MIRVVSALAIIVENCWGLAAYLDELIEKQKSSPALRQIGYKRNSEE